VLSIYLGEAEFIGVCAAHESFRHLLQFVMLIEKLLFCSLCVVLLTYVSFCKVVLFRLDIKCYICHSSHVVVVEGSAPCGLRGCKNRPTPFPDRR